MKPLPEINPTILLAEPYSFSETELAQALGCSVHSVASWRYNRRRPQACIKKLAAVVQKKLDKELAKAQIAA